MQSDIVEKLLPLLTPEEEAAYKLGRNHRISGKPKHASVSEYSRATGLEAIFGYLHLAGKAERIRELITIAYTDALSEVKNRI
jgi:ribonuclease-3 family protein